MLCLCPCSCSLLLCVFPLSTSPQAKAKACPPLTLCLLSVNSLFLFFVCWPHLTHFPLSAPQPSLARSLDVSFHLPSPSLRNTKRPARISVHTITALYSTCTDRHTAYGQNPSGVSMTIHKELSHVITMKSFQGSNLTEVLNWKEKKAILSFN